MHRFTVKINNKRHWRMDKVGCGWWIYFIHTHFVKEKPVFGKWQINYFDTKPKLNYHGNDKKIPKKKCFLPSLDSHSCIHSQSTQQCFTCWHHQIYGISDLKKITYTTNLRGATQLGAQGTHHITRTKMGRLQRKQDEKLKQKLNCGFLLAVGIYQPIVKWNETKKWRIRALTSIFLVSFCERAVLWCDSLFCGHFRHFFKEKTFVSKWELEQYNCRQHTHSHK